MCALGFDPTSLAHLKVPRAWMLNKSRLETKKRGICPNEFNIHSVYRLGILEGVRRCVVWVEEVRGVGTYSHQAGFVFTGQ